MDIDGNTYSGRFPMLFGLGSAVFKIAVFTDLATMTAKPWVHYVPVTPELNDLKTKMNWARNNDA